MLGRLFFFLSKRLREVEAPPTDENTRYFFNLVKTEGNRENRYSANRKWPYSCYQVETVKALDKLLFEAMQSISQTVIQDQRELGMFAYGLFMRLPQFTTYVNNLEKSPAEQLCPLVHSSENLEEDVVWMIRIMEYISSEADIACQEPYENQLFCNLPKIKHDLDSMKEDHKRAGSSTEMKLFAFYWFLAPGLASICDDAFHLEFSSSVLQPHATSALARLDEISELTSTSGTDLRKIRTFIYDYCINYFREYAAAEVPWEWSTQTPFSAQESPTSKYNTKIARTNIHPKTENDFLTCYKTFIATLNGMELALGDGAEVSKIQAQARSAQVWFLHPQFRSESFQRYNSFLDALSYNMQHTDLLVKFGKAMKYYNNTICRTSNTNKPVKFCNLYDALLDIQVYAATLDDAPTVKILNPTSDYKKVLELTAMRSIQADIAALEIGQEQLEQTLFNMRSSLGNHFHQLATFDQDKAEYDVGFLQDKINDFTARIRDSNIKEDLKNLLYYASESNTAEMTQLSLQLAAALAENMNPIAWITGGGGVQDALDQANALAVAGVDIGKLYAIQMEILPQIKLKAKAISDALKANTDVHVKLNTTFHQLKDQESIDIDTVQSNFLVDYKGYDPGWSNGDIAGYTVLLKGVIEELCEMLYSGSTTASAVVQIIGATKSVCLKIKTSAEILEAVYHEMYDFQYDFMESMAVAVRALVTKHSANTVRNLPEREDDPEQYRLFLKIYAFRIKIQSKQHILLALKEVCNVDEYKNGGVLTTKCTTALASQELSDIDRVIGDPVDECPSDQTMEYFVRFPAKFNPDREALATGVLDLTKIYAGELTPFKIPYGESLSWIQKYVSYSIPSHEDVALYVNRFEIYLPDMTNNNAEHEITVTVKQDGVKSVTHDGLDKYGFSTPKTFNLVYGENKESCVNGFDDSPYPELCPPKPSQLCIASQGVVSENEIAPPLYSNWLVQITLPRDLPVLRPSREAPFYLRGVLSICYKNPKNIDLSDLPRPSVEHGGSSEDKCCLDGQYWYTSEYSANVKGCEDCPPRSRTRLGGLYCHDTSEQKARRGYRGKKNHIKNHQGQHHHKAKSLLHRAIKKNKARDEGNKKREQIKKSH